MNSPQVKQVLAVGVASSNFFVNDVVPKIKGYFHQTTSLPPSGNSHFEFFLLIHPESKIFANNVNNWSILKTRTIPYRPDMRHMGLIIQ